MKPAPTLEERVLAELKDSGLTIDQLLAGVRARHEGENRAALRAVKAPAPQPDEHWAARRAWHRDGAPIYGAEGLKEFFLLGEEALDLGDQVGFSRAKDLMYKAASTWLRPQVEAERRALEAAKAARGE